MNNRKNIKSGISLIVLVITIIVIVILSGAVILSIVQNSPISQANEATFKSDLDAVKSDLSMYIASQYASNKTYEPEKLNANELSVEYNGTNLPGKTIKDVISVLNTTDKYDGQFEIVNGKLVYVGADRAKKRWAQDVSIDVSDADRLDAVITSDVTLPVSAGTDVVATIKYSSNASIDTINLTDKLELLDENNVVILNQPGFVIGTPSGTNVDALRTVNVTIKTDPLMEGSYKLRLKPGSVYNIYDVTMTKETVTNVLFEIDNTPPANPSMAVDPTGWTNGSVNVTITYPADSTASEYSIDGTNWSTYTTSIVVTDNNTTVYARATDISGNQSGQSTITIANIDKDLPTVAYAPNGGNNLQTISTKVTVTDVGVSNVKSDSLQYVWNTQNTSEPTSGWTTFTNGDTITRVGDNTYYLWVKALDNAGNTVVSKSNSFEGDITPPTNPTMSATPTGWTNGNVTVTITYPADANVKEYSTDAADWSAYTTPIIVTTNNTTVYARATDLSGNQSGQSTLTVANIDKALPSIVATYTKADGTPYVSDTWTNQSVTITSVGNDGLGSGINRYQITYEGATYHELPNGTITLSTTGRTGVWVRAIDNAGNVGPNSLTYLVAIDKWAPIVSYGTNGATNTQTASTTVTVTDEAGLSGLNTSTLQYVWDTQNVTTPASGWATFTNGTTITKTATGTYYLWIKATDNAGNTVTTKSNAFTLMPAVTQTFSYNGSYQTWTVPYTGTYKLEVWGAQGGNNWNIVGGLGAYSSGNISLTSGTVLYVYVGGQNGYNGGGAGGTGSGCENGAVGGGATDIRLSGTALANRIIVAGGGGGASGGGSGHYQNATGFNGAYGGGGSGTYAGGPATYHGAGGAAGGSGAGNGGSAAGGDITSMSTYGKGYNGGSGTLGQGGAGGGVYGDRLDTYGPGAGGGGGGGYYGGGGGGGGAGWWGSNGGAGGGGSNYIGGVTSGQMIAGNATMPSKTTGTMVGNSGNGYVRITNAL